MRISLRRYLVCLGALPLALALALTGCDDDREIIDVDAGDGGFEVEQDRDDGSLEIDVDE